MRNLFAASLFFTLSSVAFLALFLCWKLFRLVQRRREEAESDEAECVEITQAPADWELEEAPVEVVPPTPVRRRRTAVYGVAILAAPATNDASADLPEEPTQVGSPPEGCGQDPTPVATEAADTVRVEVAA